MQLVTVHPTLQKTLKSSLDDLLRDIFFSEGDINECLALLVIERMTRHSGRFIKKTPLNQHLQLFLSFFSSHHYLPSRLSTVVLRPWGVLSALPSTTIPDRSNSFLPPPLFAIIRPLYPSFRRDRITSAPVISDLFSP